ncbi:MAG: DNA polymerase domain-containing protein [Candidatus Kariarchaeaceae archaeon]|jgi:DNA polymerase elongation subunit (family B)
MSIVDLENPHLSIRSEGKCGEQILLDITYQRKLQDNLEHAEIVLFTRDAEGKRNRYFVNNFLPYFYINSNVKEISDILEKDQILQSWLVSAEPTQKIDYNGGKHISLIKISGKHPWLVPAIRARFYQYSIKFYEADIPFTHRFMIDMGLGGLKSLSIDEKSAVISQSTPEEIEFHPTITSIDIEIDSSVSKDEGKISFETIIEEASRRITGIGFYWNKKDGKGLSKLFVLDKDDDITEENMIKQSLGFLWSKIDPDVIITYNGDIFDFPYLIKRMQILGIPTEYLSPFKDQEPIPPAFGNGWKIPGVLVYDLYKRTRWMYTADGRKTLDSVANQLLGTSKIDIPTDHGTLWRQSLTSIKQKSLFDQYLQRDVELTHQLWDAMHMPEWLEVIKISGAPPGDAMYFTERQSGEFLVFHTMFQNNILIPPAPTQEERKQRKKDRVSAQGGLVLEPTRDISNAVLICDFTSMYPSIIAAHNVGAESFMGFKKDPTDRFKMSPKTSMAIMQEQILNKRIQVKNQLRSTRLDPKERKKLMEYNWAVKLVANSTYGGYNYIGSRFYNTAIAQSITGLGRNYLSLLSEKVKEFDSGYETIYGDTDSVFIETPLAEKLESIWNLPRDEIDLQKQLPEIAKLLNFLSTMLPEEMRLELQDIAYRIIFHKGAKKRYAYVSALTKDIAILGFEAIRHDWSPFAKDVQRRAFDLLLRTGDLDKTKQEIISYIQESINTSSLILKNRLITFGPIKRQLKQYRSHTPAVAAFLHHTKQQGLDPDEESQKIEYFPFIITWGNGPLKNRAKHPDYVCRDDIDLNYYIDEALRTINRFNLSISLNEVKGVKYLDLVEFFKEDDQT